MTKVLLLHGPNLNLLGIREPEQYGTTSLETLNDELKKKSAQAGIHLDVLQSHSEAVLIEAIHRAYTQQIKHIIFNPAAFTHTSIALRDALLAVSIPFTEVHLSNLYRRESFRQHSYFSDIAEGVIQGFGIDGYRLALEAIIRKLT
jgi:3-dehydroquinate dehydratase II